MSGLDDLIRKGLKDLAEPASPAGAFERVARGRRRRHLIRRAQTVSLVAAILIGGAAGLVGLARAFNLTGLTPGDRPVAGPTVTPTPSPGATDTPPRPCRSLATGDLRDTYPQVGRAIEGDVTGDGTTDHASILGNEDAPPNCRNFLAVEHEGGWILTPITPIEWMPDVPSLLMAVEIDGKAGLELVVDFGGLMHPHRTGQIFSFDDGPLVQMRTDDFQSGISELFPLHSEDVGSVDCAGERGTIVISVGGFADGGTDNGHYDITRTFYRAEGAVFVKAREESYTVEVGTERERWPEVADDPFRTCPRD